MVLIANTIGKATLSNCGKVLLGIQYRLGTERSVQAHHRETCGYGKNLNNRDHPQPSAKGFHRCEKTTHAVQRLNGSGHVMKEITCLRYSPSTWKQGLQEEFSNFHMVAKGELVGLCSMSTDWNQRWPTALKRVVC
jgi:hypothetical protein